MKKPISVLSSVSLLILLSLSALGQTAERPLAEPSFEAVLHVLHGSREKTGDEPLPRSLGEAAKHLRTNFEFENYSLVNTHLARIANAGTLDFKGISSVKGGDADPDSPTVVDWQVGPLRTVRDEGGREMLQLQSFRFGTRVPIKPQGAPQGVVNYENVGLNLARVTLPPNSPTILGTLSLPKGSGSLFLVLTVRPVGN